MSTTGGTATLGDFVATIARTADIPAERLAAQTRLVPDLGLDSLALTEVVVTLVAEYDMATLADDVDDRDWNEMTAQDLYDEYLSGRPARRTRRAPARG